MVRLDPRRWFAGLRTLDPNVRSLGLVSFFADLSSEIAYPLFPIFVTTVLGAPVALLESYTGRPFAVKEVDCWCTGDRTCRFTAEVAAA